MCFSPVSLYNPTKVVARDGGQLLKMQVPCNKCAECVNAIRTAWRFRAYHQAKDTIAKGGYVYFDTLTYTDDNVPHISDYVDISSYGITDFMCFSYKDLADFLKRLRRYLDYHYHNAEFKYFATTEYGTSENGTHRPHIHINFYVCSGIHPYTFSEAVHTCWQKGRTDGVVNQSRKYVAEHIYGCNVGFGDNTDDATLLKLCNYVAKYITKDSTFQSEIDKRIKLLEKHIDDKELLTKLKRTISQYHRQSQGFGLSYIYGMEKREIIRLLEHNEVLLPSSTDVVESVPLPMYYKRKLFYQLKKRADGTYYWEYTDLGLQFKEKSMFRQLERVKERVNDVYINATPHEREYLEHYLDGRSLDDYAIYKVFYKGRCRVSDSYDYANLCPVYDFVDTEVALPTWIDTIKRSCYCNQLADYQVYNVLDDDTFNLTYFHNYDRKKLFDSLAFNQDSCYRFRYLDDFDSVLVSIKKEQNIRKQKRFEYVEALNKLFKHYG